MGRFREATVLLLDDVKVKINGRMIFVQGIYGMLSFCLNDVVNCKMIDKTLFFTLSSQKKYRNGKSLLRTTCSLLRAMLLGVTAGFTKKLQLVGVGYRAVVVNNTISLTVGFSHIIDYKSPSGVTVECPTLVDIIVHGSDKQLVGQVAADLRAIRPPEPFSGKGIRYVDEVLRIKEVKKK